MNGIGDGRRNRNEVRSQVFSGEPGAGDRLVMAHRVPGIKIQVASQDHHSDYL